MTAPTPATAEELREAQRAEYGTYVALSPIFINGARAFNANAAVPVSHVERGVVGPDEVAKPSTKAGREALRAAGFDYPEAEAPAGPSSTAVTAEKKG